MWSKNDKFLIVWNGSKGLKQPTKMRNNKIWGENKFIESGPDDELLKAEKWLFVSFLAWQVKTMKF